MRRDNMSMQPLSREKKAVGPVVAEAAVEAPGAEAAVEAPGAVEATWSSLSISVEDVDRCARSCRDDDDGAACTEAVVVEKASVIIAGTVPEAAADDDAEEATIGEPGVVRSSIGASSFASTDKEENSALPRQKAAQAVHEHASASAEQPVLQMYKNFIKPGVVRSTCSRPRL